MSKQKFLELLLKNGALKFGSFKTKSGRMSPYFFNLGLLNHGEVAQQVAELYAETIKNQFGLKVQNLFGPAYKGITLAVSTSMLLATKHNLNATFTFNRKEAKDHGEGGNLVGYEYKGGENVVIIEDVLTGGTSFRESMKILKPFKVNILGAIIGVDRQEKGVGQERAKIEIEKEFGFSICSILTLDEIISTLSSQEILGKKWIDQNMMESIRQYRKQYG